MALERKTILGIDPGTNILGFGVIEVDEKGKAHYVDMGVVDLRKEKDAYAKLTLIYETVSRLCEQYSPSDMALESPFYQKNAQVIFKLGRAQAAALLAASTRGVSIFEYAPRMAKVAITGNGAASKEQVAMMIRKTLDIDIHEDYLDATDALAIAMCHFYKLTNPLAGKGSSSSWEKFLKENPDRIVK